MSIRVLVVDDEAVAARGLGELLRLEGYDVAEAGSGREALVMLAAGKFDVVLVDQRMPGMTGIDLLHEMRARGIGATPIMTTAHGSWEVAQAALDAGAVALVSKPIDFDRLKATLAAVGDLRRAIASYEDAVGGLRDEIRERP